MNIAKKYYIFLLTIFSIVTLCSFADSKRKCHIAVQTHAINVKDDATFWQKLAEFPFPKNFKWGIATSAFQLEGSVGPNGSECRNSWTISNLPQPGNGADHWNCYKEDVQLIKQLGMNSYRFSLEWSKINPAENIFNQAAMDHYIDLCRELINNGIEPIPCLFHHAWPAWFDAKGGFEKKENIKYFVQFARYVFDHLINEPGLSMWMTFNEPVGYAMEGWIRGHYPPHKKNHYKVCGTVVLNMLRAHTAVYHLAKKLNPQAQIGFPHIFNPLDSYHYCNPLIDGICARMNYLLHDAALDYFKTGKFYWPYITGTITDDNPYAKGALDYIGINFYSHTTLKHSWPFNIAPKYLPHEKLMGNRALYPKGLWRAIKKCAQLHIPIYITENGIKDPEDTWKNEYLKHHLFVIVKALEQGYDIRGYFWWTLIDCFEWSQNALAVKEAHANKNTPPIISNMGLYAIDPITKKRILRPGAKNFIEFLHTQPNKQLNN